MALLDALEWPATLLGGLTPELALSSLAMLREGRSALERLRI
ncbi:MAG: hypothetical protein Q8S33_00150 [Myxococcales bacterium]|nr:hypothetical protein [Myxococcales bacterium]